MQPSAEHRKMFIQRLNELIVDLKAFGYDALEADALMAIYALRKDEVITDANRRKYRDSLPAEAAGLWRQVASASRKLKQTEAAADAFLKVGTLFGQCRNPLVGWQAEALQKSHGQAGLAFHEAAQAAAQAGDKAKAAHFMLKAAQCFAASPLPLKDWQAELKAKNPGRAGLLWHELSKEAQAAGQVEQQAECMLRCAEAYRASGEPLKDWAVELRDKNPTRAGALLMDLAKTAEQQGRLADAATLRLKTAEAYRASTQPLADWQQDQRDNNAARAGYLHHQLAEAAKKKGDKAAQAEHLAASADCFARSTVPLKAWQTEARDGNHLKAGKLMGAVAEERQNSVRGEELADLYRKAAGYYQAAPMDGTPAQIKSMGDLSLKAADIYRQVNRYKVDFLFQKEISCIQV